MRETPSLGTTGWMGLIAVILLAASARIGYLAACCDFGMAPPPFVVQGDGPRLDFAAGTQLRNQDAPTEFDNLVHNRREHQWFGGLAPLADKEEQTAHVAPGYYWLASYFTSDADLRRLQAGLGLLTVVCLFFFARCAFASNSVATIVGTLAALHPFWIVNLAELADGAVITFLLAAALFLGTSAARTGGKKARKTRRKARKNLKRKVRNPTRRRRPLATTKRVATKTMKRARVKRKKRKLK